jgi:lysophospholipase L1-like esterase
MGYRIAATPLLPVLYVQGRRLHRTVPRLPEPPGARVGDSTTDLARARAPRAGADGVDGVDDVDGVAATTPGTLRLLVLGDSAAAGVGAASQDEALLGRLVAALGSHGPVAWRLVARTGATAAGTRRHLAAHPPAPGETYDVAVVSLGLNDVIAGRPAAAVLDDLQAILDTLARDWGVRHAVLTGMPPVGRVPALPQPLRWYLGGRARAMNAALDAWAAGRPDREVLHLEATLGALDAAAMATDGFHPGPPLYAAWGRAAAARVRAWHGAHGAARRSPGA